MKNHLHLLRKAVKDKGLTQQEIAEALNQDQSLISKKLRGDALWQPHDMPYIEQLTENRITRSMLRPDIYLPESVNA